MFIRVNYYAVYFRFEEVMVSEILIAAVWIRSYTFRQKPWGNCKIERLTAETVGGGNIDTGGAAWFRFISEIQKGHKAQLIMWISLCHVIHSNNWKLIKNLFMCFWLFHHLCLTAWSLGFVESKKKKKQVPLWIFFPFLYELFGQVPIARKKTWPRLSVH